MRRTWAIILTATLIGQIFLLATFAFTHYATLVDHTEGYSALVAKEGIVGFIVEYGAVIVSPIIALIASLAGFYWSRGAKFEKKEK